MTITREPPDDGHDALRRKYDTLARNYQDSVKAAAEQRRQSSELHAVAAWALQASPTGWAMVRGGKLRLTNQAFDRLDRGSVIGPGWQRLTIAPMQSADGAKEQSLAAIVVEEA